jgi:hypothetical protein
MYLTRLPKRIMMKTAGIKLALSFSLQSVTLNLPKEIAIGN